MRIIALGIEIAGNAGRTWRLSIMPQALIRVARGEANRYLIAAAGALAGTRPARFRPAPGVDFR